MIDAINAHYHIKTEDLSLNLDNDKLKINFFDKLKLITGCRANKKMKRMLVKGYKRLAYELDLMDMVKNHKIHGKILKTEV